MALENGLAMSARITPMRLVRELRRLRGSTWAIAGALDNRGDASTGFLGHLPGAVVEIAQTVAGLTPASAAMSLILICAIAHPFPNCRRSEPF